jgi:hypothetical protein
MSDSCVAALTPNSQDLYDPLDKVFNVFYRRIFPCSSVTNSFAYAYYRAENYLD